MDSASVSSLPSLGPAWQPTAASETAGRKPKLAELFLKTHERMPQPLSGSHADFVETHFEVEDASSYVDALLALEGIIDRLHYPNRHHIRMLLSLCFFPFFFRPPVQSTDASLRASRRPRVPLKAASGRIAARADDPLVVSQRQIRQLARDLVADVIGTNGVEIVCDAIKGYGLPEREPQADSRLGSEEPVKPKGKYFKPKQSRRKLGEDHPDFEQPVETEDPLAEAANQILFADDLWDVLAGTTARKAQLRTSEKPLLPVAAWEVLRELVKGWEAEAAQNSAAGNAEESPEPLSLLRYFKPSASSGAACELSNKALDVIFWPFSDHTLAENEDVHTDEVDSDKSAAPSASDSGSDLEDLRAPAKRSRPQLKPTIKSKKTVTDKRGDQTEPESDGTPLLEKREVAIRLFGLVGECAVTGYLGSATVISEFTHRLKGLEHENLLAFLETAAALSPCPPFLSRLLWSFLETHSHPVSALALLRPDATSETVEPETPVSPRKLGAQGSAASVNGSTSRSTSMATYWSVPGIDSTDFVRIVASVPIEVSPMTKDKKPASRGMPQSFRRADEAAEIHLVMKHLLADLLTDRDGREVTTRQEERIAQAFAAVEQVVDDARSMAALR